MMLLLKQIAYIVAKDLRLELRTREAFGTMLMFSVLIIVVFNFTFEPTYEETLRIAPGLLWVAFTFAGVLGLNRSFAIEKENNSLQAMMLAPVDRGAIYLGKTCSNFLFMLTSELCLLPLFALFYNFSLWPHLGPILLVLLLGTLGFAAVGTILSGIAVNTRMRDVMLPILLFPVAVPIIIGAVETTSRILLGEPLRGMRLWIQLLVVFDVVFLTVSYLVFDYVLEE